MEDGNGMKREDRRGQEAGRTNLPFLRVALSIALGVGLIASGIAISFAAGFGTIIGFLFGIPLILAGIGLPYMLLRDSSPARTEPVKGVCPHCGARIETPEHLRETNCPVCHKPIAAPA